MDADALFALYQLEGERELGRVNVKILKNRLGGYVDTIFPMTVNYDTLKISDWGGESDDELDNEIFNNSNQEVKQKTTDSSEIDTLFENLG